MFNIKFISNLDKAFADGRFDDYEKIERVSGLLGERIAFQLLCDFGNKDQLRFSRTFELSLSGELAKYATIRQVRSVPALNNARGNYDEDFLRTTPALIPDVLMPLPYKGKVVVAPHNLVSLWIEIDIPHDTSLAGKSHLSVNMISTAKTDPTLTGTAEIEIEVIGAELPLQKLLFTQWFHSDCLANYYKVEKWSDEHFHIIENFAKTAVRNGINMLFTPLISPPLDNAYDTRDLQLATVTVTDNGDYEFDWKNLERWIDMCDGVGVKYFEIGHLFTQGGADFATKVMGKKDGVYQRLFSVDTPCDAPEYTAFLRAMLTSFLGFMKARGDDKRCYFHISDEPPLAKIDTYAKAKASISDLLEGYPIMDALSDYDFYESGIMKKPVVILNHLKTYIDHGVESLWTYNCCAPDGGYSNRFLGMTLARNRSISLLLYKYNIEGFLHWGYNFYNNSGSCDCINPFIDTSAGDIFPAGDAFSVYPADDGTALESMRLITFHEAIQDLSAFRLCESLYSRDEVIAVLESTVGSEILPNTYINDSAPLSALREKINEMIKERI